MGQGVPEEPGVRAVLGVHDLELLLLEEDADEPMDVRWGLENGF